MRLHRYAAVVDLSSAVATKVVTKVVTKSRYEGRHAASSRLLSLRRSCRYVYLSCRTLVKSPAARGGKGIADPAARSPPAAVAHAPVMQDTHHMRHAPYAAPAILNVDMNEVPPRVAPPGARGSRERIRRRPQVLFPA